MLAVFVVEECCVMRRIASLWTSVVCWVAGWRVCRVPRVVMLAVLRLRGGDVVLLFAAFWGVLRQEDGCVQDEVGG